MKRYVKKTIGIFIGFLLLIETLMVVIDPLFQYHYPWFGMKPNISADAQYYAAGMAKNFEYENVIIGTSMSQNFRASWFEEAIGGKTVKLTIGGAMPKDYKDILKLVLDHGGVKRVFMDLSNYFLIADPTVSGWNAMPTYLYNSSLIDDASYLFNKDLLIVQGGYQVVNNISENVRDIDEAFCWDNGAVFSADEVRAYVKRQEKSLIESELKPVNKEYLSSNINWLCKLTSENPEIEFYFFIPPYSSAYWYLESLSTDICEWKAIYEELAESIIEQDNAQLYYFYGDKNVAIENWNLYRDVEHYNSSVNKYILECFTNGKNILNKNNYLEQIDDSFTRIKTSISIIEQ